MNLVILGSMNITAPSHLIVKSLSITTGHNWRNNNSQSLCTNLADLEYGLLNISHYKILVN